VHFYVHYILFRYRSRNELRLRDRTQFYFAPGCGAGSAGRKRNFCNGAASQMRPPQRIFYHCDFWDLEFFMLLILGLRKILIATPSTCIFFLNTTYIFYAFIFYALLILIVSTFVCPGTFLFFLNLNQKHFYSTVFFYSGAVSYGSNCSSAVIFNIYSIKNAHNAPDSNLIFNILIFFKFNNSLIFHNQGLYIFVV
jgi:hypothetical protein